jgi:hypothetical protein
MMQFIQSGRNTQGQRVILWRTGEYQYALEVAGRDQPISAEFYDALRVFHDAVIELDPA